MSRLLVVMMLVLAMTVCVCWSLPADSEPEVLETAEAHHGGGNYHHGGGGHHGGGHHGGHHYG